MIRRPGTHAAALDTGPTTVGATPSRERIGISGGRRSARRPRGSRVGGGPWTGPLSPQVQEIVLDWNLRRLRGGSPEVRLDHAGNHAVAVLIGVPIERHRVGLGPGRQLGLERLQGIDLSTMSRIPSRAATCCILRIASSAIRCPSRILGSSRSRADNRCTEVKTVRACSAKHLRDTFRDRLGLLRFH